MEAEPDFRQWNVISLGAGVQSSTMALMAAHGEITPMPDFAVFADTQDELPDVYEWLEWLESVLPFEVVKPTKGKLSDSFRKMKTTKDGRVYSQTNVPLYTLSESGERGRIPHRSCTRDYKIRPIQSQLRKLCGVKRGERNPVVVSWVGISLDEIERAKPSRDDWNPVRWPLLEKRMTRSACSRWMADNGYPEPPRSACFYCPFHSNSEWRRIQIEYPLFFEKAVEIEKEIQAAKEQSSNFATRPFLHPSCKPLDTIDFRSDIERGQGLLWQDECDGMCGV